MGKWIIEFKKIFSISPYRTPFGLNSISNAVGL